MFNKREFFHKILQDKSAQSDNNSYGRTLARLAHAGRIAVPTANHIEVMEKYKVTDRIAATY